MAARQEREHQRSGAAFLPKSIDLSRGTADEIEAIAAALSSRPRKTLEGKTPAEALNEHPLSAVQAGIAMAG